ncbi:MAG: DUF2147 domain-containing protein, partial [Pseudomonadota bacterium]
MTICQHGELPMPHNTILKAGLLAAAMSLTSPALASNSINGNWITQEKDAIIKIGRCGKTICGRISRYLVTPPNGVDQKDIHNPNKKLRSRKLLGTAVLTGFKPDGNKWRGQIYDP